MHFCEECGNMLLPTKKGKKLFCRVCKKEFNTAVEETEYKIKKKISKSQKTAMTAIIEEDVEHKTVTDDDRKAYEEYFLGSGE